MKPRHKIAIAVAAAVFCMILAMSVGSERIGVGEMLTILKSRLTGAPLPEAGKIKIHASIWLTLRVPRAVMAFLVGAALSAGGAAMQSVLRNPLASCYTLGVSSGASLAVALVILTGFSPLGRFTAPAVGFIGSFGTVLLAMLAARRLDRSLQNTTVILVGMVLSLFVNAVLTLVTAFSQNHLQQLIFWQMGSFNGQSVSGCMVMLPVTIVGVALLMRFGREMDLMTFGREQALSAGVEIERVKLIAIALSALLTGSAVSFAGVIGFVDLIAPHVVRRLFGGSHRRVVPMSALVGGSFMVIADLLSRSLLPAHEIPVGAVTALVGAPFFTFVYFRRRGGTRHV